MRACSRQRQPSIAYIAHITLSSVIPTYATSYGGDGRVLPESIFLSSHLPACCFHFLIRRSQPIHDPREQLPRKHAHPHVQRLVITACFPNGAHLRNPLIIHPRAPRTDSLPEQILTIMLRVGKTARGSALTLTNFTGTKLATTQAVTYSPHPSTPRHFLGAIADSQQRHTDQ